MKSRLRLQLEQYLKKGYDPLHMPGHKRRLMVEDDLPYAWDLTEVSGTDDLHHASGILKEAMDRTSLLCHSDRTWYLVNGSTSGNLSAVYAMTHQSGEIIMARNCHRSLFHAVQLRNLHVHWLMPEIDEVYGIACSISPEDVRHLLKQYPKTELVVVTSPTYEGVVSDIRGIAEVCHDSGVPLFVDEAHGAHFGLSAYFPKSAMQCGADVSVQSFHKTLPSLTQTAVLHLRRGLAEESRIEQALDIFETSSPSYPLMVSLDACTEYLISHGEECFVQWKKNLDGFDEAAKDLKHIRVLCHQSDSASDYGFYDFDRSKILVHSGISGKELQDLLREKYHFELEMSIGNNVLAMSGPGDDPEVLSRFAQALKGIDAEVRTCDNQYRRQAWLNHDLEETMTVSEAAEAESEEMNLNDAEGHICHEYVYCYPPGVPILIPGETITAETIGMLEETMKRKDGLHFSESSDDDSEIMVCR